jgi:hypothetical protein
MNSLRNHLVLCVAVWCLIEVRLLSACELVGEVLCDGPVYACEAVQLI